MVTPTPTSMSSTIRSSMIWNTLELGASQILTICVFMLLTYRLPPEVFGIFAIGALFIDFLYTQAQTSAIDVMLIEDRIAKPRLNKIFGNLFLVYLVGFLLVLAASFLVSQSFEEEKYRYILPVMCLCIIPLPVQIPALYLLNKKRDFKGTALRNVVAASFSAILALGFAFSPYPEWALVAQRIGQSLSSSIFVCLRAKFWPSFAQVFAPDLVFLKPWLKAFSSQAMNVAQTRGLDLIIATSLGAAALGVLRVGMRLIEALYGALAAPIGKLWVILLPENTADQKERGKIYIDFTKMAAMLLLPTFAGLFLVAEDVVELLLDPDYSQVAGVLKVLCIVGLFAPFVYFRNAAFTATGRLNSLIALSGLDIVVVLLVSATFVTYGLVPATCALVASGFVRLITTVPILLKEFGIHYTVLLRAVYPAYIAILVMAAAVLLMSTVAGTQALPIALGLKVSAGAISFTGYLYTFHRNWLTHTIQIIAPKLTLPGKKPHMVK